MISSLVGLVVLGFQAKTPAAPAQDPNDLKDIEVPFKLGERAIIVDAKVNGRKVSLMFDTGFGGYVVCGDDVNLGKVTGTMTLRDFVGELQASTVDIKSLKLGEKNIPVKQAEAVIQGGNDYSMSYNTHCDGIMGFSVIKDVITEINFEKQKFIFHPASFDVSKRVPDNKKTFLNKLLPVGTRSMDMQVVLPNGKTMTLALDTGNAFYATTHKDVLERVGLWKSGDRPKFIKQSFVASGAVDSWSLKVPKLTIYGVPVENSIWDIIDRPSSSAESDGTVGFGFLKNFNIIIDYGRRRIWMENFTGEVANEEPASTGILAAFDDRTKRTRIFRVSPESPADKAGVKVGDDLLSIDGVEVLNMGYRRLESLLEGKVGSKVKLTCSRAGTLYRKELERVSMANEAQKL